MKAKGLLAAFLLGMGLYFIPVMALSYDRLTTTEINRNLFPEDAITKFLNKR